MPSTSPITSGSSFNPLVASDFQNIEQTFPYVTANKLPGKTSKKYRNVAKDLARDLNEKYLIIKDIAAKAKKQAEGANRQQVDKTNEALEKVCLAQNEEHPLPIKKINEIRQREYTKAIVAQIIAEHAKILANEMESLALNLSCVAKKAKKAASRYFDT
ncbi:MAG: hypothetical protein H0X29_08560 [Parachlamydiaceae bacterium]|nr:hypothetical protein [Parachlamydiaceae bacterium]